MKTYMVEEKFNELKKENLPIIKKYNSISKRLRKYWEKLVKEGIKIAKEKGLETIVTANLNFQASDGQIVVYDRAGQIDAEELLKLAKINSPELYSEYLIDKEKHAQLGSILDKAHRTLVFKMHV